jgi:MerR family transcriptional regulator, heat shock protein HspR
MARGRRVPGGADDPRAARRASDQPAAPPPGKGKYYMISVVANSYGIHPQTLRLYEREGLLKPSRTEGNTRLYSEEDLRQLEVILNLTRDLGVNLAGVEIILNMRRKMEQMQAEINEFVGHVKDELVKSQDDAEKDAGQALVKVGPSPMVVRAAGERASGKPPIEKP